MRHHLLLCVIVIACVACTLTQAPPAAPTREISSTNAPSPTASPIPTPLTLQPLGVTLTPLPQPNAVATTVPVTSVPALGARCDVYLTYSGARSDNKLSLRSEPSPGATQIFRVPNNVEVLLIPGSVETSAEGYRWLNVIYEATPLLRYQGWIARDSFETNGIRDPSIATLRPTGRQAAC